MIRRVLVALVLLVAVPFGAAHIPLFGLANWKLDTLFGSFTGNTSLFSVIALGIRPALSGFLVVEFAALVVPPWRKLRRGGPLERAPLMVASLILTLLLAAVQSYFIYQWLSSSPLSLIESPGIGAALLVVLGLVGGTALLLSLAWLNDRFGVGSGISLFFAWESASRLLETLQKVPAAVQNGAEDPTGLLVLALSCAGVIAATVWLLRRDEGGLRLPVSGVVPLDSAAWLLLVPVQLGALVGYTVPGLPLEGRTYLIALALLTVPLGWLFAGLFTLGAEHEARKLATRRSLAWLLMLVVLMLLPLQLHLTTIVDPVALVVVTAVLLDLKAEWRARRREPTLVAVWPIHQVALVEKARDVLAQADIAVYPRALHHRALLQFFGPYLPIDLMVPAARAAEAQELLAEELLAQPM
jgi:SecY